jgi:hypothetical protein
MLSASFSFQNMKISSHDHAWFFIFIHGLGHLVSMLKEFKQAHEIFKKFALTSAPGQKHDRRRARAGAPTPLLPSLSPVFRQCVINSVIVRAIMCISSVYFESVAREAYFSYRSTSTSLLPHTKPNTKAFSSPSPTAALVLLPKPRIHGKPCSCSLHST